MSGVWHEMLLLAKLVEDHHGPCSPPATPRQVWTSVLVQGTKIVSIPLCLSSPEGGALAFISASLTLSRNGHKCSINVY